MFGMTVYTVYVFYVDYITYPVTTSVTMEHYNYVSVLKTNRMWICVWVDSLSSVTTLDR